ncbi:hypothetical protein Rcae01_01139 [Novipirellula caenicola]|uniref:Uncharacterized protein n=1 Tax=Novipirellula caenicola TaxID=1536901 RepID=A0ABP9VKH8_9BACT
MFGCPWDPAGILAWKERRLRCVITLAREWRLDVPFESPPSSEGSYEKMYGTVYATTYATRPGRLRRAKRSKLTGRRPTPLRYKDPAVRAKADGVSKLPAGETAFPDKCLGTNVPRSN